VFALLLQLTNHIQQYHQAVIDGRWSQQSQFCLHLATINELAGQKMAIIGSGDLGLATAKLATAFGMEVLLAERPQATEIRPGRVEFEQALRQADVISLHCPLTEHTRALIDATRLSWLKPSALLVNTARGALIDEAALLAALKSGQLAGAALDVLSEEPPPASHGLVQANLPNLLITPHVAWASQQAMQRLVAQLAENLAAYQQGGSLRQVN